MPAQQAHGIGHVGTNLLFPRLRFTAGATVADGGQVETQGRITTTIESPGQFHMQPERPDPMDQPGVQHDHSHGVRVCRHSRYSHHMVGVARNGTPAPSSCELPHMRRHRLDHRVRQDRHFQPTQVFPRGRWLQGFYLEFVDAEALPVARRLGLKRIQYPGGYVRRSAAQLDQC